MRIFAALLDHREICERPRLHLRRRRVRRRRARARVNKLNGAQVVTGAQGENGTGRTTGNPEAVGEADDEDGLGSSRRSRCWTVLLRGTGAPGVRGH
eukprot:249914-Pyramimonas_sp.AAC.1